MRGPDSLAARKFVRRSGLSRNRRDILASRASVPLCEGLLKQDLIGVAEIDVQTGRVTRMNGYLVSLLGCRAGDASSRQLVILAGLGPRATSRTNRVAGESWLKRRDGGLVRVRFTRIDLTARRDGICPALLLIEADTARQHRDGAGEQGYRELYENVTEGVYRSSLDGRLISANPALVRLNGYESESEMLAAVSDIATEWYVDPGRRAAYQALMHTQGRVENFVSEIYRHRTRERIWISENARVVTDPATGGPLYYEGTVRDVTEMVRRLDLEERLRAVIDTIADTIVIVDAQGRLESINQAGEEMFGRDATALTGQSLRALLAEPEDGDEPDLLRLILSSPHTPLELRDQRVRGLRGDGTTFPMLVSVTAIADRGGRLFALTARDVTLQFAHEEGLRLARDAAETANRMKSDFVSMVSHELRTPLNGVIGMTGLLLDGPLDAEAQRYAEALREAADHLLGLINDLLDFAKLDRDRLEFEEVPFEIESLVQGALELLAPRAHAKGLELGMFIAPEVPNAVVGDKARLRQVLLNLLGNALTFTELGSVSLEVSCLRGVGETILIGFEIHDTGMGIPPEGLAVLFQDFSQVDRSISRRFGGTGLGLAICRRLVEGMGGTIEATSDVGHGSVFRFSVRLRRAPLIVATSSAARADGERVLIVDDNAVNRGIFARQLASRGGLAVAVGNARSALTVLRDAVAAGKPFDSAVIDHVMPGTDGPALADAIRAEPGLSAMRLVLATSWTLDPESRQAARRVFDVVLSKPVPIDALVLAVKPSGLAPDGLGLVVPEVTPLAWSSGARRPIRILVAEDNRTNQLVISAMLDKLGHHADVVGNGLEAVEAVRARPYDLVLMDVMMPELDGIGATRRIRQLPGIAARLPILALTAHASAESHVTFREAGMDDVLTKPVTLGALVKLLASHVPDGGGSI